MKEDIYEQRALRYAEEYGIITYTVKGNKMIYKASFPPCGVEPHYTMKRTVDLDNMTVTSERVRFDKKGYENTWMS